MTKELSPNLMIAPFEFTYSSTNAMALMGEPEPSLIFNGSPMYRNLLFTTLLRLHKFSVFVMLYSPHTRCPEKFMSSG